MDSRLAPLVKRGGLIALALPGLKKELTGGLPPEMALSWTEEDMETIRSAGWWAELLSKSREVELLSVREMDSFDECWADWLACDNSYAVGDRRAMGGRGREVHELHLRRLPPQVRSRVHSEIGRPAERQVPSAFVPEG